MIKALLLSGLLALTVAYCHRAPPQNQIKADGAAFIAEDKASVRAAKSEAVTHEATDAIQALPEPPPAASDALPDDLHSAWLDGVKRVRDQGDHSPSDEAHPTVPAS